MKKYNWPKLKREFFTSDIMSVTQFLKSKDIPISNLGSTKGWGKDKKSVGFKAASRVAEELAKEEVEDVVQMKQRQARLARFLQYKGAMKLKNTQLEEISPGEARKMIVDGLHQERESLRGGQESGPSSLTQINIQTKTNYDKLVEKLDYEGILKLIAELKRERNRRSLQEPCVESPGEIKGERA